MKIIIVTLVLTIHVIVSKYPDNKRPEYIYNFTALDFWEAPENYTEYGRKHAFPSTIRISPQGDLFVSVPRHIFKNETIESTIPGTFNIIRDKTLYPWPSSEENNYYGGRIHSVVGFEIDLQGRVWLLNYNNNRSSNLLIYDKDGKYLYEYNLTEVTIHRYHESYLTNILLDLNGSSHVSVKRNCASLSLCSLNCRGKAIEITACNACYRAYVLKDGSLSDIFCVLRRRIGLAFHIFIIRAHRNVIEAKS